MTRPCAKKMPPGSCSYCTNPSYFTVEPLHNISRLSASRTTGRPMSVIALQNTAFRIATLRLHGKSFSSLLACCGAKSSDSRLIDEALYKIWNIDKESRGPEIARTTFLKATCAERSGHPEDARKLRAEAFALRRRLLPGDRVSESELVPRDFDELVAFWSR